MAEYKGTYHNNRGELLKDNISTGEYFKDKKGIFKDTSGLELAQKRAEELNNPKKGILETLKDNVMGTDEQNKAAQERMDKAKENNEPVKKAKGGKISSASSRGDGCAIKGKTKGRMV